MCILKIDLRIHIYFTSFILAYLFPIYFWCIYTVKSYNIVPWTATVPLLTPPVQSPQSKYTLK